MEQQVRRLAAICGKYYDAWEETGHCDESQLEWIIGKTFANYSVALSPSGIDVCLPDPLFEGITPELKRKHTHLSYSRGRINIPPTITDAEFEKACEVMEENFERVAGEWKRDVAAQKAESIRLVKEKQDKLDKELKRLQG